MDRIGDLFGNRTFAPPKRRSERGDLLVYIADKLNRGRENKGLKTMTPAAVGHILQGFTIPDLYFIKSDCDRAEKRGIPWGAAFWSAIRPQGIGKLGTIRPI